MAPEEMLKRAAATAVRNPTPATVEAVADLTAAVWTVGAEICDRLFKMDSRLDKLNAQVAELRGKLPVEDPD